MENSVKAVQAFQEELLSDRGISVNGCYQCMTCTLGCPASENMDIFPHEIIRSIQMGEKDRLLSSSAIWKCLGCETCFTRCPNEINIPGAIDSLKNMCFAEKKAEGAPAAFHRIFLKGLKKNGVLYELGLMLQLKLVMKDFFSDIVMGMKMILGGKLSVLPHSIKDRAGMKRIFDNSGAEK